MRARTSVPLAILLASGILAGAATGAGGSERLAGPSASKPHGDLAKVGTDLLELRSSQAKGGNVQRLGRESDMQVTAGERVMVDVYVRGPVGAAAEALRAEGMDVRATSSDPFAIVEGLLPIEKLDDAAAIGRVRAVTAAYRGGTDVGGTLSQGDASHRGPAARALGPTGAGVTVGVISDSIDQVGNGVDDSQATGDLPADPNVVVLKDDPGQSDEGRAMAEIIYDTAPGVPRFLFASGTAAGAADKADSINQLVANGARVIADDIFYLSEPFFQDGTVSQTVNAARAAGVSYFASAGNRARQSYESTFRESTTPGFHDFDPGAGDDNLQTIVSVPNGANFSMELQWDEPWGAVQTDLDLFLGALGPPVLVDSSQDDNIANGMARESVSWTNNTGITSFVGINILRFDGTATPFMKYIARGNFGTFTVSEFDTSSDTINPDAASATGALTTAAIAAGDAGLDTPEVFSSRGPKVRLFDTAGTRFAAPEVRQKPEIAAADAVSTSVPDFDPFFGTSAATPSAAGVGALILSAKPTNIADDVYAILKEGVGATDCPAAGKPDTDCGIGFVFADSAVTRALDPTPPTVTPSLNPPTPNGANGFYVTDVTVGFGATDDGSPITSLSGCAPVTINTDTGPGGRTVTCAARSAGGTTTAPVTIKRDTIVPGLSGLGAGKRGTRFGFTLTEDAGVTITVQRKRKGKFRKVRSFKVNGKAGKNTAKKGKPKKAKAGRYRVRMQATDLAGNKSPVKSKKFRVKKRK